MVAKRALKAVIARGITPLAALLCARQVRKFGERPLRHQPVFIIGAPRTGSTILYQALTNCLEVTYIDNLACRFCGSLFFGVSLSRRLFGDAPHNNFSAVHGDTTGFGAHAPSECGAFWYRWLPRDRHFVALEDVRPQDIEQMRREITAVINRFDRPMVFKNLNAGQRLRLLHAAFPNARFIYVKRNLPTVVRSILEARRRTATPAGEMWSIRPRNYQDLLALPEIEMVVAQVTAIERQIEEDLALFDERDVKVVDTQKLSMEVVEGLGRFIEARPRAGADQPQFRDEDTDPTPSNGPSEIDALLQRYEADERSNP